MGSREKDQTTPHQPLLSSVVVRPTESGGAGGGTRGVGGGNEYELGEVRRDPLSSYSRPDRFSDNHGYRFRAGSGSPVRRRDVGHHLSDEFDRPGGPLRSRGYGSRRSPPPGRYHDHSPPYSRGRAGGRLVDRGFVGSGFGPGSYRGEGMPRNNPNVCPREGDWICPDPLCNNLNFARKEYCHNCNRIRYAPRGSPRRGYPGPPSPRRPPRHLQDLLMERSPGRPINGYWSPRAFLREGPRELGTGGPPHPRHEGRFLDHPVCRDRLDFPEEEYRERMKFDRLMPPDWACRDHRRDNSFSERKGYERRLLTPPLLPPSPPPPSDRWGHHDMRERNRSPIRGGLPLKDYHRDI